MSINRPTPLDMPKTRIQHTVTIPAYLRTEQTTETVHTKTKARNTKRNSKNVPTHI